MKGPRSSRWWAGALTTAALSAGLAPGAALAGSVSGVPLPGGSVTTTPVVINALPQGFVGTPAAAPTPTGGASQLPFLSFQAQPEPTAPPVGTKPNEPPSPSGAVGPTFVLSVTNTHIRVMSRPTPTTVSVVNEVSLASFWGTAGVQPSDTRALYDAPTDTWYVVAVANAGTSNSRLLLAECAPPNSLALSNPSTGTWTRHSIAASIQAIPGDPAAGTTEIAQPKIGISSRWVAVTAMTNLVGTLNPVGQRLWIIPKSAPTSSTPGIDLAANGFFWPISYASQTGYTTPGLLAPSQCMEFAPVTEGTRASLPSQQQTFGPDADIWFVDVDLNGSGTQYRMTRVQGQGQAIPSWTDTINGGTWIHSSPVPFNPVGPASTAQPPAPQPGGAPLLEVGNSEVESVVMRRGRAIPPGQPNAGQATWSLWFTCVGGFPFQQPTDRVVCLWNELDLTQSSSGTPQWVNNGAIDGGVGVWSWRPSLAVNSTGDMCIGYTQSSPTLNPSACYDSRQRSTPANTLLGPVLLWPSAQPHVRLYGSRNRWGDFSATCIDGADDASFWTFQEYADVANTWGVACGALTPASVLNVPAAFPNIQAAIAAASNGDIVLVQPGTYTQNIAFGGKNIQVRTPRMYAAWPGGGSLTSIQPASGSCVTFVGTEDGTALLGGFRITNSTGSTPRGGGVLGGPNPPAAGTTARIVANLFTACNAGTAGGALENCDGDVYSNMFQYSFAAGGGGCDGCDGEFRGNRFFQCSGTTLGGALNGGSGPHIDDFYELNLAPTGGGAFGSGSAFSNCTFKSNSAFAGSGGALAACTGTVTVCRLASNLASTSGGAFSGQLGAVTFCTGGNATTGAVIFDNRASFGGAFDLSNCTIASNLFLQNKATGAGTSGVGGAIRSHAATGSITSNLFDGNTSTGRGGAIADTNLPLVGGQVFQNNIAGTTGGALDNCNAGTITATFNSNRALNGGAIANIPAGTTALTSAFNGNIATASGGAASACGAPLTTCTFAFNQATSNGGALNSCTGVASGCTFTSNSCGGSGGAINAPTANVTTCTFTSNTAQNGGAVANATASSTVLSCTLGNNVAGGNGGCFFQCSGPMTGNLVNNTATLVCAQSGGAFANCAGFMSTNGVTACRVSASGGAFFACSGSMSGNAVANCNAANGGAYHSCNGNILGSSASPTNGNTATSSGGAFHTCSGQIVGVVVTNNTATSGDGGGFFNCGPISVAVIDSNHAPVGRGGGIFGSNGVVAHCVISNNTSGGNGAGLYGCTSPIDACNIFLNVAASGFHGGGMSFCTGAISNNTIHSNTGDNAGGIHNCDTDIWNNTIMLNAARVGSAAGGIFACNGAGNTIRNNILFFNTANNVAGAGNQIGSSNAASFCCIEGGGGGGTNNSNGTPQLVNITNPPASRDFHELATSASTIDTGRDGLMFLDFDSNTRPIGAHTDIGAFER